MATFKGICKHSLHGIPLTKRSWENGNCSFDAVDFTVGLDPFGSQVPVVGWIRIVGNQKDVSLIFVGRNGRCFESLFWGGGGVVIPGDTW